MNFQTLINPLYWLTTQSANVNGLLGKILFGVFLSLFILGIVSRIVAKHRTEDRYLKLVGQKFGILFVSAGLLGMLLFFFSFEAILFFGARFWYPILFIGFVVWFVNILRFIRREVPSMKARELQSKARSKYMPPRRKR